MSLYIGNLSSRIRVDDLERVFRRFGRCRIQVKDRYGFAVYDYPACAEKALKALQGTRICGEALTLSWSNHQPRAAPKFGSGGRSYKPPRRNYSAQENAGRRLGFNDQRDAGRIYGSSDLVDEPTSYPPNVMPKDHLEDDRWVEQVDPSNEIYLENGVEFDRYDPDHSAGIKELDEHQTISSLAGSPSIRKSEERTQNANHRKSMVNCYLCGELGHKMHNCPLKAEGQMSRSHRRIGPRGNAAPSRFQESENEPSTSRNRRKLLEDGDSSLLQQISPSGQRKETDVNKRNRRDYRSPDKDRLARTRGPSSSSNSDHNSPRLQSPSRSLRSLSLSPCRSGSKSLKSPSISRSTSPPPPSNKEQTNPNDSVANAVGLSHNRNSFEEETLVRSGTSPSISQRTTSAVEVECGITEDASEKDNECDHFVTEDSDEILEPYPARVDGDDRIAVNLSPHHVNDPGESETTENRGDLPLEEICTVLKHYGLPFPDENRRDLPVGSYFGSARLWPWEIIYYRRLKKGPISAENYSRRVMQNREFGIVDRFIRGSSGWGERKREREPNENNP